MLLSVAAILRPLEAKRGGDLSEPYTGAIRRLFECLLRHFL
jgi:hypothetical protein